MFLHFYGVGSNNRCSFSTLFLLFFFFPFERYHFFFYLIPRTFGIFYISHDTLFFFYLWNLLHQTALGLPYRKDTPHGGRYVLRKNYTRLFSSRSHIASDCQHISERTTICPLVFFISTFFFTSMYLFLISTLKLALLERNAWCWDERAIRAVSIS